MGHRVLRQRLTQRLPRVGLIRRNRCLDPGGIRLFSEHVLHWGRRIERSIALVAGGVGGQPVQSHGADLTPGLAGGPRSLYARPLRLLAHRDRA